MEFVDLYNTSMLVLLLPLAALAFVAIKYVRNGVSRIVCSLLFVLSVLYMFLVPLEFTSYPKPTTIEWFERDLEEAEVLWGSIDPDTLEILALLSWPGEETPRLYKIDNFETQQEQQEFAQEMQDAQRAAAQEGNQQGRPGNAPPSRLMIRYPFLTPEERRERLEQEAQASGNSEADAEGGEVGMEQENDSQTFHIPPPPAYPEKTEQ